jgi:hypothetical protein
MRISWLLENHVFEHEAALAAQFIAASEDAFADPSSLDPDYCLKRLQIDELQKLRPVQLVPYFTLLLATDDPETIKNPSLDLRQELDGSAFFNFAEYLVYGNHVPVADAFKALQPLGSLVATAYQAQSDAYAGCVVYGAFPMLLFVSTERLLLCGAAQPLAGAWSHGLKERLLDLLRYPKDLFAEDGEGKLIDGDTD